MRKIYFLFLALLSSASIVAAVSAEVFAHLPPCPLCMYQRYVHATATLVGVIGFWIEKPKVVSKLLYFKLVLLYLLGTGFAFYQFGLEQAWFTPSPLCRSALNQLSDTTASIDEVYASLLHTSSISCDMAASLGGVSMALLSGLWFLVLSGASIFFFYEEIKQCKKNK